MSGCATIPAPPNQAYPFRAGYLLNGAVKGNDISFDGALLIDSSSSGMIEIYGPTGITLYALSIREDSIDLLDTWGRSIKTMNLPCDDALSLIAGLPPKNAYLYKKTYKDTIKIRYLWGYVILDKNMRPKTLHMKLEKNPVDIDFLPTEKGVTLIVTYGHDKLSIDLSIKEGGRWA